MKKTILTLLIVIASASGFAEYTDDVAIPLLFSSRNGVNVGFSTAAPTIAWKESWDIGTKENPITFHFNPDSETGKIKSDEFCFYVQIYTSKAVKISVSDTTSSDNFWDEASSASRRKGCIASGSDKIPYESTPALFDSNGAPRELEYVAKSNVPRVRAFFFNLEIDPDDLIGKNSTEYTGQIAFEVEIQ